MAELEKSVAEFRATAQEYIDKFKAAADPEERARAGRLMDTAVEDLVIAERWERKEMRSPEQKQHDDAVVWGMVICFIIGGALGLLIGRLIWLS